MHYDSSVAPILKWVGGKRQLLPQIKKFIPDKVTKYYEPFFGGGALLFDIQPKKAIVNDVNTELINFYKIVRDDIDGLVKDLKKHKNTSEYFYDLRALDRDKKAYSKLTNIQKASRIHFLNKTCYNGLFRVNNAGQFNAPYGKYKNPNIVNESSLRAVSRYFNDANIELRNTDFENSIKGIRKGCFVYFDPPYDPISDSASFTGYVKGGFGKSEQVRLKKLCDKLNARGIKFLLSNSSTDFIHDLYKEYKIDFVSARRLINSDSKKRGGVNEVLVRNYEC